MNGATAQTLTAVLGTNTGDWIGDISTSTPDKSDIGGIYAGGAYSSVNYWNGTLDEVRLSNVERSDDWVATEYNNQNSPSTFYTLSSPTSLTPPSQMQWLVADQLGTPRMIADETGSLANMKRHDYLPFGEELLPPTGGRTTAMGYASDGIRHQFTAKEWDVETGLDYFGARYYASLQGRFTTSDPLLSSGIPSKPQSWNRYAYCLNSPLNYIDPKGLIWETRTIVENGVSTTEYKWVWQDKAENGWNPVTDFWVDVVAPNGQTIGLRLNPDGPKSFLRKMLELDPGWGVLSYQHDYHVQGYEFTPSSEDRRRNNSIDMMPNQAIEVGLLVGGLRGTGEVANAGIPMAGKAYEIGLLNRHLPETAAAAKAVAKDQAGAFVFKDLSTLSRVEAEIFARGEYTGTVRGWERFGVRFNEPIGTQIRKNGTTTVLDYGEMKIRSNGLYHVTPRTGPAKP